MEQEYDVIIIGAGAAGLMAAFNLSKKRKSVLVLEARERIGGRAFTDNDTRFTMPIERGAEFVHGNLPVTLTLLQEAKIAYTEMEGRSYTIRDGRLLDDDNFGMDWGAIMKQLNNLEKDMPLKEFLDVYFSGAEHLSLRESVIKFAQGFDAADPALASTLSLRSEWMNDNEDNQFRIDGGYKTLFEWLAGACTKYNTTIKLKHVARAIDYTKMPRVTCTNGSEFCADKVLLTLPLGIWQNTEAMIRFKPSLPEKIEAAKQMGFGNVIKVNVECSGRVWETNEVRKMPDTSFIFSDSIIPTWWTQNPALTPQLSGWLAGPPADVYGSAIAADLRKIVIKSLSYILQLDEAETSSFVKAITITNWGADPYALGGYSYETLASGKAKKVLMTPVNNKLFFAGEALYEGSHNATVEAAFESAIRAVKEILQTN